MTASLARFLPDFGATRINILHASRHQDAASGSSPEPEADIETIRAQARAEGEAVARAELSRRHDSELEAARSRHAAELAAVKEELEILAARSIPDAIAARATQIADLIAADVEAVLAPLIDEAVRARILSGLANEIRTVLDLDNSASISVSGPQAVISALRDLLGPVSDRLVVGEADGVDVEVEYDRTRFASRISDWSESLSGNLK